jgi:hypothetical protein
MLSSTLLEDDYDTNQSSTPNNANTNNNTSSSSSSTNNNYRRSRRTREMAAIGIGLPLLHNSLTAGSLLKSSTIADLIRAHPPPLPTELSGGTSSSSSSSTSTSSSSTTSGSSSSGSSDGTEAVVGEDGHAIITPRPFLTELDGRRVQATDLASRLRAGHSVDEAHQLHYRIRSASLALMNQPEPKGVKECLSDRLVCKSLTNVLVRVMS